MGVVRVYIDGFNVYHAIDRLNRPTLKWLNYYQLGLNLLRSGEVLDEVHFFTAILRWNAEKQARHANYISALRAVGVTVHESNFKKSTKHCRTSNQNCKFFEEKQTDVAIAIKIVADALAGKFTRAILITADSDQIPTAKLIASLSNVSLTLRFPPGRQQEARDLGNVIRDRKELTPGLLGTCQLPRSVLDSDGATVATMPALYTQQSH